MILSNVAKIVLNQNKTLEFLTSDNVSVNGILKPSSVTLGLDNMLRFNSKDEDFQIDCRLVELVQRKSPDGTIGYSHVYTPISDTSTDADVISARASELYDDVLKNILVPCCSSGPSVIYGAVAVYPTSADFPAEGDSTVIYIDDSAHIAYYWNGSSYSMLNNNVVFYPDSASFPILGTENVLYVDQATPSIYIWTGSGYIILAGGSISVAWGDITGTVSSQTDLVSYLSTNYYPLLTNPAGYLTAGDLSGYVPLAGTVLGSPITGSLETTASQWAFKGDASSVLYQIVESTADTGVFGLEAVTPTYYGSVGVNPSNGSVYLNSQQTSGDRIRFYIDSSSLLARIEMPLTSAGVEYANDHSLYFTNRSLVDKEYVTNAIAAIGVAAWGSIDAGTGVGSQTDLVTYLDSNYYPLSSNPAGYLTDQYAPTAGTGISITGTSPTQTITNTLPDQTVVLNAGTGIGVSGTYPNFTITNTNTSVGGILHGTASGTDTYAVSITGVTSYSDGDAYLIRFTNGNTTASTLNINSIGAATLYKNNDGALIGGDIISGGEMLCVYNSTLSGFQVIGTSPNTLLSYVTNADSVTLTKGMAVYAFGGTGDRMTVKRAYNTGDPTSAQTVGLVLSSSIASNQKGLIIMQGLLDGLSILPTSTFADGDSIFLGATAGTITNVKPYAPNHLVYLGVVTTASNGSSGRMYVRVQNGYELDELHNVQAQTPTYKDTLWYDNTVSPAQWKTGSISSILGLVPISLSSLSASTPLSYDSGTGAFSIQQSSASQSGYLSSTDWSTFNNKVASTRSISTTTPLTGGGDLSANRTLAINQATTSADGYLSSTDWNTFNNKVPASRTLTINGVTQDLSANRTFSVATVSAPFKSNTTIAHTGTTSQTTIYSSLIPAGTFSANDFLYYWMKLGQSVPYSSNNKNFRVYFNTSATHVGGTLVAFFVMNTTVMQYIPFNRRIIFQNSLSSQRILTYGTGTGTASYMLEDVYNTSAPSLTTAINFAVDQYVVVSCELAVGTDTAYVHAIGSEIIR